MKFINIDYNNKKVIQDLVFFLKKLFPDIDINEWNWEYKYSPIESHSSICLHNDNIIGHSALIGIAFIINGKVIRASKFEGSLINLKYLLNLDKKIDKRIFHKIILNMLSVSYSKNTNFIFGFPAKQAIPSQLKSGFKLIDLIIYNHSFPINLNLIAKSKKIKNYGFILNIFSLILKFWIQIFQKNYNQITEYNVKHSNAMNLFSYEWSQKNINSISVYRSNKYIKWKYSDNPISKNKAFIFISNGKITGFLGIKINENQLIINDIASLNILTTIRLIRYIFFYSKNHNISLIELWFTNTQSYKQMRKLFFIFGFIFTKKIIKKIIYHSENDEIISNINNLYINKSFLR